MKFRRVAVLVSTVIVAASGFCYAQTRADPGAVPPAPPGRSSTPVVALGPAELAGTLKKGGLVLYIRHTATDFSQNDAKSSGPQDCANQRNLVDRGRADARAIGTALKQLGVPIARVLASPTCRTAETSKLVFGRGEPSAEVRGGPVPPDDPARYAGLRKLLSSPPPAGGHLAISSHGNPFFGVAGPPYLAEGEMALVRPLGSDFEVVARIRVEDWPGILAAAGVR